MTIKVSELAKKLGRTSKEVVSKAKELGIVAKAANIPYLRQMLK